MMSNENEGFDAQKMSDDLMRMCSKDILVLLYALLDLEKSKLNIEKVRITKKYFDMALFKEGYRLF